jgi:hypothetical protein
MGQISFAVAQMASPNFSRESCGQLKQPKYRWKIGNDGRKVKYGRITGWAHLA